MKLPTTLRRDMGLGRDILKAMPKPTKAARWKVSMGAARKYADSWAREYVRLKYPFCVTCGSTMILEWAHVLSGKGDAVKWDELNIARQCQRCNQLHESHPEHLYAWFWLEYGHRAFDELVVKSNQAVKLYPAGVCKIGDAWRERVRAMKGGKA